MKRPPKEGAEVFHDREESDGRPQAFEILVGGKRLKCRGDGQQLFSKPKPDSTGDYGD